MCSTASAAIFDMDGVLCRYDFDRRLARMAEMTGVDARTIKEVVFEQGFEDRADAGAYTADAYHREFCRRIGAPLGIEQFVQARAVAMEPDGEVLDMVRRVTRRARVAMLTNNGPVLENHIDRVFPEIAEIFGGHAYFSCRLGVGKPDPRVFLAVCARLETEPAETLFVDDCAEYVQGARQAGLMTHHFRSAGGLRAELEACGLL